VWFESEDVELRAATEAFASTFLIPALGRRRRLELADEVCPVWSDNVALILPVLNEWWSLPVLPPSVRGRATPIPPHADRRTALCFSAGIDSFYSLLRSGERVDVLVTVQGFDIGLDDTVRMDALAASAREIAAARGCRLIVIRTNLRSHPLMQDVAWERAHGGALAALAHVLDGFIERLLISSSIVQAPEPEPWGSHWQIDPLWSSARVSIANIGSELLRTTKLEAIATEPLVRSHLRVCWENRTPHGNCSRCEKCLVARLKLFELGVLGAFPVFEGLGGIDDQIDALPRIKHMPRAFNKLASSNVLHRATRQAVRRLVRRTKAARSLPQRIGRHLAGWVRGMLPTGMRE
jgi:hypothetical protein